MWKLFNKPYAVLAVSSLLQLDKQKPGVFVPTTKSPYNNLNLNYIPGYQKHSVDSTSTNSYKVIPSFKKHNDNLLWDTQDQKSSLKSFVKTLPVRCFDDLQVVNQSDLKLKHNVNKELNRSTLSFHISNYENSIESTTTDKENYSTKTPNPFEFARQQENDPPTPEIMDYKSTQKLLHPNQSNGSKTSPAPNIVTPKRFSVSHPYQRQIPKTARPISPSTIQIRNLQAQLEKANERIQETTNRAVLAEAQVGQLGHNLEIANNQNEVLTKKNAILSNQVKEFRNKQNAVNRSIKRKEKNEIVKEAKEKRQFDDFNDTHKRRIITDKWNNLVEDYGGEKSAKEMVNKLYNKYVYTEFKQLSALETLRIIKTANLSFKSFQKIKSELKIHGPLPPVFASYYAVNKERQRILSNYQTSCITVPMKDTVDSPLKDVRVIYLENIKEILQQRLDDTVNAGNFKMRLFRRKEELWFSIIPDKGGDTSKLAISLDNTFKPINSAFNLLYLALFSATDSYFNIEAAWKILKPTLETITELRITENGVSRMVPVRFFFIGDYKIQRGSAGIRDGNCNYPCVKCLCRKATRYSNYDFDAALIPREMKVDKNICQDHMAVFDFIPFSHYISPPLHCTIHFAGNFFDLMLGVATSKDAKDVEFQGAADLLKNNQLKVWKKKYEKLEEMKEDLEECQNTVALFEAFDRGDKPDYPEYCASENCVAKIYDSNVPFEAAFPCQNCSNYFHHCCVYRKQCPVCSNKYPPEEVSLKKIDAEKKKAEAALKKLQQQISNEEKDVEKFLLDHKLGPLGKCFEAALQKHGGTKKAFFQAYTGQQLLKMGNSLDSIIDDLPKDITDDPYFQNIATAFNKFLDIKFLLNSEDDFSQPEVEGIKNRMKDFAHYMKENLPDVKVKQLGHYWISHVPEFLSEFKSMTNFSDESIEASHAVSKKYEARIKTRDEEERLEFMMRCNREDTYLFDNITCKSNDNCV